MKKLTNKITKLEVEQAANLIVERGEIPTIAAIRVELKGRGSETTIHNYLKEWKKARLLQPAKLIPQSIDLLEENRNLTQTLAKQAAQNEYYANELINAEKIIIELKEEVSQLQKNEQELQLNLTTITARFKTLDEAYGQLITELDLTKEKTIIKQQQTIAELQEEIKEINAKSIAAIREIISTHHDLVMQEKIQIINLQAKVEELNKQLLNARGQYQELVTKKEAKESSHLPTYC